MSNQRGTPGGSSWSRQDSRATLFSQKTPCQRPATTLGAPRSRPGLFPPSSADRASSRPTTAGALRSSRFSVAPGSASRLAPRTGFGVGFGAPVALTQKAKDVPTRQAASSALERESPRARCVSPEVAAPERGPELDAEDDGSQFCSGSESELGDEEPSALDALQQTIVGLQLLPEKFEQEYRDLQESLEKKADALSASEVRHAELDADIERASELVQQYEAREEAVQKKYDDLENDLEASESDLATAREEIETMEHKSKESENRLKGELSACHEEAKALRKTFEAESAAALQMSLKFEEVQKELVYVQRKIECQVDTIQDLGRAKDAQLQEALKLSEAVSALRDQNSSLLNVKSSLESALKQAEKEASFSRESFQQNIDDANDMLKESKSQLQVEADARKKLRSKIFKLSERLGTVSEAIPLLCVAREQLRSIVSSQKDASSSIMSQANNYCLKAGKSVRATAQSMAEGQKHMSLVCSKLESLMRAHAVAEKMNDFLEHSLADSKKASENALRDAQKCAESQEKLAREQFRKELVAMEEEHSSGLKELEKKLTVSQQAQTDEIHRLSNDCDEIVARLKEEHEAIVSKLKERIADCGEKCTKQEMIMTAKKAEILSLRDEMEQESKQMRAKQGSECEKLRGDLEYEKMKSRENDSRLVELQDLLRKREKSDSKRERESEALRGEIESQKVLLKAKDISLSESKALLKNCEDKEVELETQIAKIDRVNEDQDKLLMQVSSSLTKAQEMLRASEKNRIGGEQKADDFWHEIGSLKAQLEEKNAKLLEVQSLLKKSEIHEADLDKQIAKLDRESDSHAMLLKETTDSLTKTQKLLKQSEQNEVKREDETKGLTHELGLLKARLKEKEETFAEAKASLKKIEMHEVELEKKVTKLNREIDSHVLHLEGAKGSLAELRKLLKKSEKLEGKREKQVENLNHEVGTQKRFLREKDASVAETRSLLKDGENREALLEDENSKLRSGLEAQEQLLKNSESNLARARASLEASERKVVERNEEATGLQSELESQKALLEDKITAYEESQVLLKQANDCNISMKKDIAKLRLGVESQEMQLKEAEVNLAASRELLTKTDGNEMVREKEIAKLRLEVSSQGKRLKENTAELSDAQNLLSRRQKDIEDMRVAWEEDEKPKMRIMIDAAERKAVDLQSVIRDQEKEISSICANAKAEKEKLAMEFEAQQNAALEISASTRKDLSQMFDRASAAEEKIETMACTEKALRADIESAMGSAEAAVVKTEKLSQDLAELEEYRDSLSDTLKNAENNLRSAREQQLNSSEVYEKQVKLLFAETESLRRDMATLQESLESAKSAAGEANVHLDESAQLYMNTLAEKDDLQKLVDTLQKAQSSVQKRPLLVPRQARLEPTVGNEADHSIGNDSFSQLLNLTALPEVSLELNGGIEERPREFEQESDDRLQGSIRDSPLEIAIGSPGLEKDGKNAPIPVDTANQELCSHVEVKRVSTRSRKKHPVFFGESREAESTELTERTPEPGAGVQGSTKRSSGRLKLPAAPKKVKATNKRPRPLPIRIGSELDLKRAGKLNQRSTPKLPQKPHAKKSKKAAASLLAAVSAVEDDDDDWTVD